MKPIRALSPLLGLALAAVCGAQGLRDQFDAFEYQIPMRDGVKLYTVVFVPKGKTGPFPILMERTPYGAGSPAGGPRRSTPKIVEAGYILAYQDVRGKNKSEGDFVNVRPTLKPGQKGIDEATDTYDTVDYLLKTVPKNNGAVGLWGISYPGFYAGAGAIRNHPGLKAVSPQAPVNDWFMGDDVHHNGVLFLQETFDFGLGFNAPKGQPRVQLDRTGQSAYDWFLSTGALPNFDAKHLKGRIPYWNELMEHSTYDEYWKDRALWRSFKDVKCAVLTVGGWFDKEDMWGALNLYKAAEIQNPSTPNFLVMGPWSHGQWASGNGASLSGLPFGSRTGQWYQENVELPFFERYLKGRTDVSAPAEATVFETGRNAWNTFPKWPPVGLTQKSLFMGPGKSLTWEKPSGSGTASYIADPFKPTPYLADWKSSARAPGDWLAQDRRFTDGRSDTVTFTMPALKEDLRVAGPVTADLWITTTGTDADVVVELIDEFPADTLEKAAIGDQTLAGYQMMVRGDIMRAKFRNSFEKPEPIKPGVPTRVRFNLNDVMHTFKKGHRIMVRVQSYWFPIGDRNPNTFVDIAKAKDSDFQTARVSVMFGGAEASSLKFGVLPPAK